jgi:excisionase family DNA binding protein
MPDETARLLVDVAEAAKRLSVSKRTVQSLVFSGQLASVKVGRCRRIPVSELTAYVERLRDE